MKSILVTLLLVALFAMALAGVHHYKVPISGPADRAVDEGGNVWDAAASVLHGVLG